MSTFDDIELDRENRILLEGDPSFQDHDRLWVNQERTVLVRLWASGTVEVATRAHPAETWGPPVYLEEEK